MEKRMTKGIVAIAGIVVLSVCVARGCTSSETVADYAATHPEKNTEVVLPTIEAQPVSADLPNTEEVIPTQAVTEDTEVGINEEAGEIIVEETTQKSQEDFYIEEIDDILKERMQGKSYADDIDESIVNYSMLRHLVIKYYDFNNEVQTGEVVCNEKIAEDLLEIFEELYNCGYQLESVKLIDEYGADDDASMEANNTSCFNYRVVDNTTKLSYHAYGLAIDVNPFYNPYVQMRNGELYICPEESAPYADRESSFSYKIDENDLAYRLFKEHGFIWGGDWNSCKDYQHFEKRVN